MKGVDSSLNEMKTENSVIREKIGEVETHVASLNSVEKKLSHIGIDYTDANEFRELMSWVRKRKVAIESRDNQIMKTILTTVVIGAVGILSGYVWVGFQKDVNVKTQTVYQPPSDGNVRTDLPRQRSDLRNSRTRGQP